MPIDRSRIPELAAYYRRHLLDEVMPFWEQRTRDPQGGYLTHFDYEDGRLMGTQKNMWCHGRQLYMLSALYNHLGRDPKWLALAKHGRDFIVKHGYAGNGAWHYELDREGRVTNNARSLFTDSFVLSGLCEYAVASGSREDMPLIEATYDRYERGLRTPGFTEYHHFTFDPRFRYHGPHFIVLAMALSTRPALGDTRIRPLVDYALEQVLHVFSKDKQQALFEMVNLDGSVSNEPQAQILNPGHAMESLWFCMEEGIHRNDAAIIRRAAEVMDWSYRIGHDKEYGGIVAYTGPGVAPPPKELQVNQFNERWDDKSWWVLSESLYGVALTALTTDDAVMWDRFLDLHAYCRDKMRNPAIGGEWHLYLKRDGSVAERPGINFIRAAFHIPRALMKLLILLEKN